MRLTLRHYGVADEEIGSFIKQLLWILADWDFYNSDSCDSIFTRALTLVRREVRLALTIDGSGSLTHRPKKE